MKLLAVLVEPDLPGVVLGVDIHGLRAPVVLLARDVVAALQDEDPLSGGRQMMCQRSSAGSGADDDHIVVAVVHVRSPHLLRGNATSRVVARELAAAYRSL